MIHEIHPLSSVWSGLNVSCASLPERAARRGDLVLEVDGLESVFCAVEEHAQVAAIDVEEAANFVFVLVFQEDSAKQLAIALGQSVENAADVLAHFLGGYGAFDVEHPVGLIEVVLLQLLAAPGGA